MAQLFKATVAVLTALLTVCGCVDIESLPWLDGRPDDYTAECMESLLGGGACGDMVGVEIVWMQGAGDRRVGPYAMLELNTKECAYDYFVLTSLSASLLSDSISGDQERALRLRRSLPTTSLCEIDSVVIARFWNQRVRAKGNGEEHGDIAWDYDFPFECTFSIWDPTAHLWIDHDSEVVTSAGDRARYIQKKLEALHTQ